MTGAQNPLHQLQRLRWSAAYGVEMRSLTEADAIVDWLWGHVPEPRRFVVSADMYEHLAADESVSDNRRGWAHAMSLTPSTFETWVVVGQKCVCARSSWSTRIEVASRTDGTHICPLLHRHLAIWRRQDIVPTSCPATQATGEPPTA